MDGMKSRRYDLLDLEKAKSRQWTSHGDPACYVLSALSD